MGSWKPGMKLAAELRLDMDDGCRARAVRGGAGEGLRKGFLQRDGIQSPLVSHCACDRELRTVYL